ncbi:hypothetical protein ACU6RQ_19530 (plasmid) [Zobellella denitrificans]
MYTEIENENYILPFIDTCIFQLPVPGIEGKLLTVVRGYGSGRPVCRVGLADDCRIPGNPTLAEQLINILENGTDMAELQDWLKWEPLQPLQQ